MYQDIAHNDDPVSFVEYAYSVKITQPNVPGTFQEERQHERSPSLELLPLSRSIVGGSSTSLVVVLSGLAWYVTVAVLSSLGSYRSSGLQCTLWFIYVCMCWLITNCSEEGHTTVRTHTSGGVLGDSEPLRLTPWAPYPLRRWALGGYNNVTEFVDQLTKWKETFLIKNKLQTHMQTQ